MVDKYLDRLRAERAKYAEEALNRPIKKDQFEYGTHHGYIKALKEAEQWYEELIKQEGDDDE